VYAPQASQSKMTTSNQKKYYEHNWKNLTGLQMSPELAHLGYSWVSALPRGNCLDIGCGDGTNAQKLNTLGFSTECCDISLAAIKKARAKGLNARVVDLNSPKIPFAANKYSLIWLSDVIEHVFWPDNLLQLIYRLLRPGGYVFITTPNVSWFIIRLQLLFGKTLYDIHPEHVRWFNYSTLTQTLLKHGFEIVNTSAYNRLTPFPWSQKINLLKKLDGTSSVNDLFSYTLAVLAQKPR